LRREASASQSPELRTKPISPVMPKSSVNLKITTEPILSFSGNYIYVIGGVGDASKLSTILKYDISANKWEDTKIPLHLNRGGVFHDRVNNLLTILGGRKDAQLVNKVYNLCLDSLDLLSDDKSQIKLKRSGFGYLQADNMMFIVGGNDGEQILKSVLCIKTDVQDIAVLPDLCLARDELDVAIGSIALTRLKGMDIRCWRVRQQPQDLPQVN
jgi:hypothetical protein